MSSDEGMEEYYEKEVKSDTDSDAEDVPEPADNIEVMDSEGNTLTGWNMMAWKASCADILYDLGCTAFLFLRNPIVQEHVLIINFKLMG